MDTPICIDCGVKHAPRKGVKGAFGVCLRPCLICGETKYCGEAWHDFGLSDEQIRKIANKE